MLEAEFAKKHEEEEDGDVEEKTSVNRAQDPGDDPELAQMTIESQAAVLQVKCDELRVLRQKIASVL